jgi:capsid protein
MEERTQETTTVRRQVIREGSQDPVYRAWLNEQWMREVMEAHVALASINDSPYYGSPYCANGWRVD